MTISEADANTKLARWQQHSTNLVAQITIDGSLTVLTAARIGGLLGNRVILRFPKGQVNVALSEATFEDESIENDSLTIKFSASSSCSLEEREPIDNEWPSLIGA